MTGPRKPDFVTFRVNVKRIYGVNVNITEENGSWSWDRIELTPGIIDYGEIVSKLIRLKYSDDSMTAIINNYLDSPEDQEHLKEFNEMQEWRKKSKETAKEAIEFAKERGWT